MTDSNKLITERSNTSDIQTSMYFDTSIILIAFCLSLIYLYYFVDNFEMTISMLKDLGHNDLSTLEFFAPLILFPIGLFGFWKSKKYGWTIIVITLTYFYFTAILSQIVEINLTDKALMQFIIIGGLLFYINWGTVTVKFGISKRIQLLVLGLSIIALTLIGLIILT